MGYKQIFLIIIEILTELMEILDEHEQGKGSRSVGKLEELQTSVDNLED